MEAINAVLYVRYRAWENLSNRVRGRTVSYILPQYASTWERLASRCNSVFVPPPPPPRVNVHRRTNSLANLCTIRENEHHGAHFRGVRTRVFVPPAKMCTMQIDWSWTWLLCRAQSRQSSCTSWGDHRCLFSFFASLCHKRQGRRVQTDDVHCSFWYEGIVYHIEHEFEIVQS